MPITDTFNTPDEAFRRGGGGTRDGTAMDFIWTLTDTMSDAAPHLTYARGTWGYTSE